MYNKYYKKVLQYRELSDELASIIFSHMLEDLSHDEIYSLGEESICPDTLYHLIRQLHGECNGI